MTNDYNKTSLLYIFLFLFNLVFFGGVGGGGLGGGGGGGFGSKFIPTDYKVGTSMNLKE